MAKIELLAPAGSEESLVAAVEAACDAIYLGLANFNARSRAKNFQVQQVPQILEYCHQRQVKVYITLNTLIKNNEITDLVKMLYKLSSANPDAIIIQDLGLFYLLQKLNFKHIHFSTQAGIHNSLGVKFAQDKGAERSILARELTLTEIEKASQVGETEIFVHGALCYSLSGACLFSSYLGGMSANRGKCKQPCRRAFNLTKKKKSHLFSLKDLELIDYIPHLIKAGVKSLKIEGRMKRPDYVNQVVRAYRMALDNTEQVDRAKEILSKDFGRSKTLYFMGNQVSQAITQEPFAGIFLGYAKLRGNQLLFTSKPDVHAGDKLKLYYGEEDSNTFTVTKINADNSLEISEKLANNEKVAVYQVSSLEIKTSKISWGNTYLPNISKSQIKELTAIDNSHQKLRKGKRLFIRVKSIADIANLPKLAYQVKYLVSLDIFQQIPSNFHKQVIWELPLFIPENDLLKSKDLLKKLSDLGYHDFAISHISQIDLLPARVNILANENIYTMNDLAIKQIKEWGVSSYILPLENDIPNLNHYSYKDGIIPVFFTPALFTSRMPVKQACIKDNKNAYQILRKGKLTYTYSLDKVCIFSFLKKLKDFNNFFLDLSTPNISPDEYSQIFEYFKKEDNIPNTKKFNFKKGLW